MQQRMRPVTYAESLEAKRYAEKLDQPMIPEPELKRDPLPTDNRELPPSANSIDPEMLPSGGKTYPLESTIYFSPFTFGEMKFISVSTLSDAETINFFLSKIHTSFPKEKLTYFDFYYISTLIKLATFGELEFTMNYTCLKCGHPNQTLFTLEDIVFEEIRVPLPIVVDLRVPYKSPEDGREITKVEFEPITIGRFKEMVRRGKRDDLDLFMANCIVDGTEKERLGIIKEALVGVDVNLLDTIDVSLFHGVQDLKFKCKYAPKKETDDGQIIVGEVCGFEHHIPFPDIIEYITTSDRTKDTLGERIHFGIQDGD